MLGLLDQMESENPEDPTLAPKASLCHQCLCDQIAALSQRQGIVANCSACAADAA